MTMSSISKCLSLFLILSGLQAAAAGGADIGSATSDVIACTFTEPFLNSEYNLAKQTLTYRGADFDKPILIKNVSFQIVSAGVFELVSKEGKVLQTLTLNHLGSDGMSDDRDYPYSVQDDKLKDTNNRGDGGCSSTRLKVKKRAEATK